MEIFPANSGSDGLSESEATLRALLESASQGIIGIDQTGAITMANAMAERLFGYPKSELLGKQIETLIPQRLREQHASDRMRYFSEPRVRVMGHDLDLTGRRKDGTEFPVEVSLSHVATSQGLLAVSFVTDISDSKRAQEMQLNQARELARSNSELEQFAYVVSHDLQEPLRNITAFAEMLNRRYSGQLDDQAREYLGFIMSGTVRMNELITSLLTYSRATVPQTRNSLPIVDLNEVFEIAESTFRAAIERESAVITSSDLPSVRGELTQLIQVFQNLIGNALKYRGEQAPSVQISAERGDNEWIFSVKDNGIGIAPRHKERVFGLFKRLQGNKYPGTGIGLSICRKIIEGHGGRIWIADSDAGTTVKFTLPAEPEH